LTASIVGISSVASAATYDESVNGDLSGNRLAPTLFNVALGSNTLTATSVSGDIEYFRIVVPIGARLTSLDLTAYSGTSLSFIAVQDNTLTFTEPPSGTVVGNLRGYAHFGAGNGTVGTNILDDMGTGAGSKGFPGQLGPGSYVFWSQETSSTPTTYTLNFQLTPVAGAPAMPGTFMGILAGGLCLLGATKLRKGRAKTVATA
jgi:hypothetical protein